jgi:integrase
MKSAAKRRSKKGSVAIFDRGGMLYLAWTHGTRHRIALGYHNTPTNWTEARTKANEIEGDILKGQFDPTLEKYRRSIAPEATQQQLTTVEQWQQWIEFKRSEGVCEYSLSNKYGSILAHLTRFKRDIVDRADVLAFRAQLLKTQGPGTANRSIKDLGGFFNWAISQGWTDSNPTIGIKPVKDAGPRSENRKPFDAAEIERILTAFRESPTACVYYDFVVTLLTFGLRPSEAIGLRWQHVDWKESTITVKDSLSRGGNGSQREARARKNGVATVIDMPPHIHEMMLARFGAATKTKATDLIFKSARGRTINDTNFSQDYWRPMLELANVPHRPPYASRHSMASHALEQGATLPDVAYLLGHRDTTMVAKTYGHIVKRPKLPDLGFPASSQK